VGIRRRGQLAAQGALIASRLTDESSLGWSSTHHRPQQRGAM